jgi:ABC-type branched-subunit amino acid transport system substrate-binding protein
MVVCQQDAEALYELAAEEGMPVLDVSGSVPFVERLEGEDYTFSLGVPHPEQFVFFIDFLLANWEEVRPVGAGEEINIAYISWSDEFGQAGLVDVVRDYAEEKGVAIVLEAVYNPSSAEDTVNQLLDARKYNANVIYTNTYSHGPAIMLNDLRLIGLADEFIMAGPSQAMDSFTYGYLEMPDTFNGFYAPFAFNWWSDSGNPAIQQALMDWEANQRSVAEKAQGYLLGHAGVDIARAVIEGAVMEVGYAELSGDAVYQALSRLSDFQVMDGLMIVDFSGGQRTLPALQIRRVTDFMVFEVVEDFAEVKELEE